MKRIFICVLLLSCITTITGQSLYDDYNSYFTFSSSEKKYESQISQMVRFGFDDIFKYTYTELNQYKDSIKILSRIESVTIELNDSSNLERTINHLTLLPNLKFLKFKNDFSIKRASKNIVFPKNLNELAKLETIVFTYYSDWDLSSGMLKLSELPNLKNIGFTGFPSDIFLNEQFLKLDNLEGILFNSYKQDLVIPNRINDFKKLKSLILIGASFSKVEFEFKKLSNVHSLEDLILAYMDINDTLAKSFENLSSLKRINLSSCKIASPDLLFSSIGKKNVLTELKLSNNELDLIPKEIKRFKNLENFYSSNNLLGTTLPKEFYNLNKLKSIEIQGSTIEIIDENINNLKNLEVLKLYFNEIHKFSENLDNLKKLRTLYLNNNELKKIPEQIELLSNLEYLNVNDNKLTVLPKNIGSLINLNHLEINNNLITVLPNSFVNLKSLVYLDIEKNNIQKLPVNFGDLNSLKSLKASFNFIEKLPADFGKLTNLKTLELTQNNLKYLPENFGNLINLEQIYLDNSKNPMDNLSIYKGFKITPDTTRSLRKSNNIQKLPYSFKNLKKLSFIRLSMNENIDEDSVFKVLKHSLFSNYRLELDHCNIDSLPKEGWSGIKVKSLNVSNNNIKKLPPDIINAKYLSRLNLYNNDENLHTYRENREEINLLFEEEGFISKEQQPRTTAMAIAYADVANKKSNSNQYGKVIEYAERGMEIDEELTLQRLYKSDFIEALYKTGNYEKAIKYADLAIKKDTSRRMRILNSIVPNFQYKAKSQLAIGDTLGAIATLSSLAKTFNRQTYSEIGILAKRMNNDSLAAISFAKAIMYYEKYIEKSPEAWGYQLSLLELYIIADKKELATKLTSTLNSLINKEDYKILLAYFKVALKIIYEPNLNINDETKRFESFLRNKKTKLDTWSFQLFLEWNDINNLSVEKKSGIKKITALTEQTVSKFLR